ncbi:MAG TPA: Fic family protein [Polyangia bacterium]|nr:Fic family protein [Polyangia bacterium]
METKFFTLDNKVELLREQRMRANPAIVTEFDDKLDQSWIYHDNALEGVVLSYHELKAAIDKKIISDVSLIPMYEEIKNHKAAIEMVRQMARTWAAERHDKKARRKNQITIDTLKLLHSALTPEEKAKGNPYRKDNPLHRLYFHEIAQPDKIAIKMRKLIEWLDEEETQHIHPVERAARAHYRLMAIFPWPKNSGKVARLLMNLMLLRDGFPPVVIHSIERQRYYDVLRSEAAGLVPLVLESLENGVDTSTRFFAELNESQGRRGRAAS